METNWYNRGGEGHGFYINPSLKPSNHCRKATNKAQAVLKQIAKNFQNRILSSNPTNYMLGLT
jgi:hypothetical protein